MMMCFFLFFFCFFSSSKCGIDAFLMPAWSSSRVASLYGVKVDWQTKYWEKDEACTKALNKMQETAQQNFEALKMRA